MTITHGLRRSRDLDLDRPAKTMSKMLHDFRAKQRDKLARTRSKSREYASGSSIVAGAVLSAPRIIVLDCRANRQDYDDGNKAGVEVF